MESSLDGGGANAKRGRTNSDRAELADRIARHLPEDGRKLVIDGLVLRRYSDSGDPIYGVSKPTLCIIAQGAKEIFLGSRCYRYDPEHYLLATAEMPVVGHVIGASKDSPFLGLVLVLESALVNSVMVEVGHRSHAPQTRVRALDVRPLGSDLLEAVLRLVRLLDTPEEIPFMAPLIKREIVYRIMRDEQNCEFRPLTLMHSGDLRIAEALNRLRKDFATPLHVDGLAEELGMSPSSFYQHFKGVTDMTPLQFQKQLQLQEARRLMLLEDVDAATAGYRVGYNSASQFSREYKRLFGRPPRLDVQRLRAAGAEASGVPVRFEEAAAG